MTHSALRYKKAWKIFRSISLSFSVTIIICLKFTKPPYQFSAASALAFLEWSIKKFFHHKRVSLLLKIPLLPKAYFFLVSNTLGDEKFLKQLTFWCIKWHETSLVLVQWELFKDSLIVPNYLVCVCIPSIVLKVYLPSYFWPLLGGWNAKPFLPPAPLHKQANAFFPTLSLNCKFLKVSSKCQISLHTWALPFHNQIHDIGNRIFSGALGIPLLSHESRDGFSLYLHLLRVLWSEFAGSVYILRCYLIIGLVLREFSSIGFHFFRYFVFDHDTVFLDVDFGFLFVDFDSYRIRILDFGSCLFYLYVWCACSV